MEAKRIVIVSESGSSDIKRKNYDGVAQAVKWMLEGATGKVAGQERKRAEFIKIVDTTEKALEMVDNIDVLIFISGSMTLEARKIKKKYQRVEIIVSTDLEDEIILIKKSWIGGQFLKTVVFS